MRISQNFHGIYLQSGLDLIICNCYRFVSCLVFDFRILSWCWVFHCVNASCVCRQSVWQWTRADMQWSWQRLMHWDSGWVSGWLWWWGKWPQVPGLDFLTVTTTSWCPTLHMSSGKTSWKFSQRSWCKVMQSTRVTFIDLILCTYQRNGHNSSDLYSWSGNW